MNDIEEKTFYLTGLVNGHPLDKSWTKISNYTKTNWLKN